MRPLRPACGTVSNAQLLTLPEIIRIIAPGEVTTQLSHPPPASNSATDVLGSSESRLATAQPPEPPPTTTKSNVSVMRIPLDICYFTCRLSLARHARPCAGHPRFNSPNQQRRGWPGRSPAMTESGSCSSLV